VWASPGGVHFADALAGVTFRNCRFDGGLPPWFFRGARKNGYWCRPTEGGAPLENKLGKATIDVLLYGAWRWPARGRDRPLRVRQRP
jgi:hypothetical protein